MDDMDNAVYETTIQSKQNAIAKQERDRQRKSGY